MKNIYFFLALILLLITGCNVEQNNVEVNSSVVDNKNNNTNFKKAVFAGGCFWCSEAAFEVLDGVSEVYSGYISGEKANPTYQEVSSGKSGHREAVEVIYDPNIISYDTLVEEYWKHIDPTDDIGQFADKGSQYTTAIYYANDEEKMIAEKSKKMLSESGKFDKPIATIIIPLEEFYIAEEYHQDYSKKNSFNYKLYEKGSGRKDYVKNTWENDTTFDENINTKNNKDDIEEEEETSNENTDYNFSTKKYENFTIPTKEELQSILSEEQFYVTQKSGTERSFTHEYDTNKDEGIYVDLISGEPLFSSKDKFDSGTGWASFSKPISMQFITVKKDFKLIYPRTEIRSKYANSHLGHVFNDGPKELGGKRYCMNGNALKFIPKEDLEKEGYDEYLVIFN